MSLTNKNEFIDTLVITIFTFFVFRFVSHDNGGNFHHYFHRYYKMYRLLIVLSLNINFTIKIKAINYFFSIGNRISRYI